MYKLKQNKISIKKIAEFLKTNYTGKDLGSRIEGYYAEGGYNLLHDKETNDECIIFARYENYNTHAEVAQGLTINDSYNRTDMTFGVGYKIAKGAMFKADYQIKSNEGSDKKTYQLNLGTAIWF